MYFFNDRDWLILVPAGLLAFALAFWGFSRCLGVECPPETFGALLQKSIRLIRGTGDFGFERDPWQLVIAQYLLPLVVLFVAAKVFLFNLRRDVRVALAGKSRNHTIVCGLSDTGRYVVDNLRAAGQRVVVVNLDDTSAHVKSIEQAGVPVIKGDATQARTLELAGLRHARSLVATSGSDPTNLEIAFRADDTLKRRGARRRLHALVEMRSEWMFGSITNHERATLGSDQVELRPFNLHQNAARVLYGSPAFERRRCAVTSRSPHLLVLGFGRMGSEIVAQGIRTAFAVPGEAPRFTIVDRKGAAASESFFTAFPGVRDIARLRFIECSVGDDMSSWRQLDPLLEVGDLTAAIVTFPDDDVGLLAGVHIRNRLDRQKDLMTPVFTRLRGNRKLGQFTSELERIGPLRDRFVPFGDLSYLTERGMLFENKLDDLARAHHNVYLEAKKVKNGASGPAELPWERLPEIYKQSNRHFADHISLKLRVAGLRLLPVSGAQPIVLSEAELDRLAAVEHWRWQIERRMAGWRHGPVRDDLRRLHPGLVGWEALPEAMREQNRASMRGLPQLVAVAGLEIRREHIVSAVGTDAAGASAALDERGTSPSQDHLVIVVDPEDEASLAVGRRAAESGAAIWLLIAERLIATLMSRDPGLLDDARDGRLWSLVESWVDAEELADLRVAGRCIAHPAAARKTS